MEGAGGLRCTLGEVGHSWQGCFGSMFLGLQLVLLLVEVQLVRVSHFDRNKPVRLRSSKSKRPAVKHLHE